MGTTQQVAIQEAQAFHLDQIPEPPEIPEFAPESEKLVMFGPIAIARAAWGTLINNEQLLHHFVSMGMDEAEVADSMERTGFPVGYYFPMHNALLTDRTQRWHAWYGATLAQRVAEARGWTHIDVLIFASSTSPGPILERTREVLQNEYQISVGQMQVYSQACNGASAGINDLCRNESMHGLKAVVIGMETLTGNTTDHTNPVTVRTFGNGGSAIAFIPGEEIQHITGRTVVEYDVNGVIVAPETIILPPKDEWIDPLPWYEIIGDETNEKFAASPRGNFMNVYRSPDGILRMNGKATLMYFAKRVPQLAVDVVTTYKQHYEAQYGPLSAPISHQPSEPVMTFINQELLRLGLEAAGVPRGEARQLAKNGTPQQRADYTRDNGHDLYTEVQIPWLMSTTGYNNISAGTCLIALQEMVEKDLIQPNVAVPVIGFGIGSVIQADIWRFTF